MKNYTQNIGFNYYPFGSVIPGRDFTSSNAYRYGFNTQEKSEEIAHGHTTAFFWEYDGRLGRRWNTDPVFKENESSYASFSNNPIWYSDHLGDDTLNINGSNNTKNTFYWGKGTETTNYNLSSVHIDKELDNSSYDLGDLVPDVVGLDLNISGESSIANGEAGLNLLWHPSLFNKEGYDPEVHVYYGGGVTLGFRELTKGLGASATASVLWGYARDGNGEKASDEWIMDGGNWTGAFYNQSLSISYASFTVKAGRFSGVPINETPTGNFWSGYSVGGGRGVQTGPGSPMTKISSFKELFSNLSFTVLNKQMYYMIYGNGGEGKHEGWNIWPPYLKPQE